MTCASLSTSSGNKGVGTRLFFDPDSCTHVDDPDADPLTPDTSTANAYDEIVCTQEITPPGTERAEEEDDGCLADSEIVTSVGPSKLTSSTLTFRYTPGGALEAALKAAEKAGTPRAFVIKHPVASSFVYEWFDAIITQFQPQSITKRAFRTATVRLTPTIRSGTTTTPADLGTGLT